MKYQLVRTSPYLSGQVRWDLIVNPSREIGDVYIRPISDNIVYNGTGSALGSRHVDNVKQLYNTIEDAFYAYKQAKEAHIKEVATQYYKDGKITEKVYNALMNYKVEITD